MIAPKQLRQKRLIQDIWGSHCLECDSQKSPLLTVRQLKQEKITMITCPDCDFTIVVVDINELDSPIIQDKIRQCDKKLIATHNLL
jgi:transcription elongation factor Elf1